jgi:hypothetical protein
MRADGRQPSSPESFISRVGGAVAPERVSSVGPEPGDLVIGPQPADRAGLLLGGALAVERDETGDDLYLTPDKRVKLC